MQLRLLWTWREVLRYLVVADLKIQYRNRVLGFFWSMLDPLLMMGVYILLVAVLFGRGGPQYPVLLFSAILSWWWFTGTAQHAVVAIAGKAKLIQSIHFPKVILPLEPAITGLVQYFLGLIVLVPLLFAYDANWTVNILWMPVLILGQLVLTIGVCLILATLGVYLRDLQNVIRIAIRALFFLSPALYAAADRVPERYLNIYMMNPFAALFESYKNVLVRGLAPDWHMLVAAGIGVLLCLVGLQLMDWKERDLAKAA